MTAIDVTTSDWEMRVLSSDTLVAVDFWGTWCPWCMKLKPIFEELAREYEGRILFAKVEVEPEQDAIVSRYGIQGVPVIKFFCDGREVGELLGFMPKEKLRNAIDEVLQNHKQCLMQSSVIRK